MEDQKNGDAGWEYLVKHDFKRKPMGDNRVSTAQKHTTRTVT